MRQVSRCAVVALIALLAISHVVTLRLPVRAGSESAGENGDANGDGVLDISDPIYLLRYLFQEGPAPVACADSPELLGMVATLQAEVGELTLQITELEMNLADCRAQNGTGLPDTGQSTCYDQVGNIIDCASDTCAGQDGRYATGCTTAAGRFVHNGDATVTDTCTGLTWQQDTADLDGDGQRTDQDVLAWCAALAYCENMTLAGHDDWRLPSLRELESILDYERINPMIAPIFGGLSSEYWSSTSVAIGNPDSAWNILFGRGLVRYDSKSKGFSVRAVRGGSSSVACLPDPDLIARLEACEARPRFPDCLVDGRFVDNADGTVRDMCTGLLWEKAHWDRDGDGVYRDNDVDDGVTHEEAEAYCQGLDLAGHTDWRLPTLSELVTLVRLESPVGFTGEPNVEPEALFWGNGAYWSTTANPRYPDEIYAVALFSLTAELLSLQPSSPFHHVRAVRGPDAF